MLKEGEQPAVKAVPMIKEKPGNLTQDYSFPLEKSCQVQAAAFSYRSNYT